MPSAYGYRSGERRIVTLPVDASTAAISNNDMITMGTAGYVQKAAAGDLIYGVSTQDVAVPGTDGAATCNVDISTLSIYEYPPDAGTVTAALLFTSMDAGGAQSINIDASADDCIKVVGVDTTANTVRIQILPVIAGVV